MGHHMKYGTVGNSILHCKELDKLRIYNIQISLIRYLRIHIFYYLEMNWYEKKCVIATYQKHKCIADMHHIKTKFINKDMTKELSIVTLRIMNGDKKSMMNTEGTINVISKSSLAYFQKFLLFL